MKGIHPEYLLGKKGDVIDSLINEINELDVKKSHNVDVFDRDQSDINDKGTFKVSNSPEMMKALKNNRNVRRLEREIANFNYSKEKMIGDGVSAFEIKAGRLKEFSEAFKRKDFGVFRVGKKFFTLVSNMEREIPFKYIGKADNPIFISTPDLYVNGTIYSGVYVECYKEDHLILVITKKDEYSVAGSRFAVIGSSSGGINLHDRYRKAKESDLMMGPFTKPQTIENEADTAVVSDMLFPAKDKAKSKIQADNFNKWMIGVINTAVYIHSQDPDIDNLKPIHKYAKDEIKKMDKEKKESLTTLPVNLVNWNYHTGIQYSMDSTMVSSHMRWQPCGRERSEVKLIWVKEHTRSYK